ANPDNYLVQRNLGLSGASGSFAGTQFAFGPTESTHIPSGVWWSALNAAHLRFMDVDGDGRPDRVADDSDAAFNSALFTHIAVQKNNGNGFGTDATWTVDTQNNNVNYLAVENNEFLRMLDINGDGICDRVMLTNSFPFSYLVVQFGNGGSLSPVKLFGPY